MVSSGNRMVFNVTNFTKCFDKTCNVFQFSVSNCHYSSFPAPGGKNSRLGFHNSLLQNFYWPWHKPIFSNFRKLLSIFRFL